MIYRDEDPVVLRRQLDLAARRAERYRSLHLRWRQSRLLGFLGMLIALCGMVGIALTVVAHFVNTDLARRFRQRDTDYQFCERMKSLTEDVLKTERANEILQDQVIDRQRQSLELAYHNYDLCDKADAVDQESLKTCNKLFNKTTALLMSCQTQMLKVH